jgi:hypothetical protein
VTVTHGQPDASVALVYSLRGEGSDTVILERGNNPTFPTGLKNPILVDGLVQVNAEGSATFTVPVPDTAPVGMPVWVQVLQGTSTDDIEHTNIVETTISAAQN